MTQAAPAIHLSTDDAVHLAYALSSFIAASAGIRLLAIKGPVASVQDVRDRRVSSDADVLIEPLRVEDFVRRLSERGWIKRSDGFAPRVFDVHSVTMFHPNWPCDIDIHLEYPGFFATPTETFEILWRGRVEVEIAGRTVIAPSRLGSAVFVALHSLKDPLLHRSNVELDQVAQHLGELSIEEEAELIALARATRSVHTLAPMLSSLGVDAGPDDLTESERRLWQLRVAGNGRSAFHWAVAMADAPWYRRIGLAVLAAVQLFLPDRGHGATSSDGSVVARLRRRVTATARTMRELRRVQASLRAEAPTRRDRSGRPV